MHVLVYVAGLTAIVVAVSSVSRKLGLLAPIALVLVGLGLSLVPGFPLNITLDDAYQKSPPLAEIVKFARKENTRPHTAIPFLYALAPMLSIFTRPGAAAASAR